MSRKTDALLSRYDSYILNNYQCGQVVYIEVELVSNKWWRFNKKITFKAEQDRDTWWAGVNAKLMIKRCEDHFGY